MGTRLASAAAVAAALVSPAGSDGAAPLSTGVAAAGGPEDEDEAEPPVFGAAEALL